MSYKVPYIVGDTFGRDHIYWPTTSRTDMATAFSQQAISDARADTNWPASLTVKQMLALAWRIKSWTLSGTWSVSVTGFDIDFEYTTSLTATIVAPINLGYFAGSGGGVAFPDEPRLVHDVFPSGLRRIPPFYSSDLPVAVAGGRNDGVDGPTHPYFPAIRQHVVADDNSPDVFPAHIEFDVDGGSFRIFANRRVTDIVVFESGGFSPFMALSLAITSRHLAAGVALTSPVGIPSNGILTIDPGIADSFDLPITASGSYINPRGFGTGPGTPTGSATLLLSPREFYAYKNSLGQAVYNTTTGAQINDPFG